MHIHGAQSHSHIGQPKTGRPFLLHTSCRTPFSSPSRPRTALIHLAITIYNCAGVSILRRTNEPASRAAAHTQRQLHTHKMVATTRLLCGWCRNSHRYTPAASRRGPERTRPSAPARHRVRGGAHAPCHVPRLSRPSVMGITTVGPMRDVFVCETLSGRRASRFRRQ